MISADKVDLLSFFEAEPLIEDEAYWPYSNATFCTTIEHFSVRFRIWPSYGDVEIEIDHDGRPFLRLKALQCRDVKYSNEHGSERLHIELSEAHEIIWKLRPHLELHHIIAPPYER